MIEEKQERDLIHTIKETLNISMDEAKNLFGSIKDKLPSSLDSDAVLKIVRTTITQHPVKSIVIAFALGMLLSKMMQK